jgi:hypothetical protein
MLVGCEEEVQPGYGSSCHTLTEKQTQTSFPPVLMLALVGVHAPLPTFLDGFPHSVLRTTWQI